MYCCLSRQLGDVFADRYVVVKKLGWGHFSTVWMARDDRRASPSAPKVIAKSPVEMNMTNRATLSRVVVLGIYEGARSRFFMLDVHDKGGIFVDSPGLRRRGLVHCDARTYGSKLATSCPPSCPTSYRPVGSARRVRHLVQRTAVESPLMPSSSSAQYVCVVACCGLRRP